LGEQAVGRGAVPVQGVGRDDPGVAGIEQLRRLALQAQPADAADAIEHLADRMAVPGRARARAVKDTMVARMRDGALATTTSSCQTTAGEIGRRRLLGRPRARAKDWPWLSLPLPSIVGQA